MTFFSFRKKKPPNRILVDRIQLVGGQIGDRPLLNKGKDVNNTQQSDIPTITTTKQGTGIRIELTIILRS